MNNIRDILLWKMTWNIYDMIREILCEQGYHVNIARNVKMALESLEKIKPSRYNIRYMVRGVII